MVSDLHFFNQEAGDTVAKVRISAKRANNNNIDLHPAVDSNLSNLRKEERTHIPVRKGNVAVLISFVLLLLLLIYSLTLFVVPDGSGSLAGYLMKIQDKMSGLMTWIQSGGGAFEANLIKYSIIILSGASLAAAGCVFQGSFRNIIASPSTMGVQAGASLGNTLYTWFFVEVITENVIVKYDIDAVSETSIWELNRRPLLAIAGALISVWIVAGISSLLGKGAFSGGNILFAGIVFSSFVGAINTLFEYYFIYFDPDDSRWQALQEFNMGNFDKVIASEDLAMMSVFLVPCLLILVLISPKLNVIVMGEDEAATMGVNVRLYRTALIVVGTIMAAVVYAFCGAIGFVGFIVPQICRRFTGPDFRKLIPMCMFSVGILLILVYDVAVVFGYTQYMNMITSVIGCSMMIYALFAGKGGRAYG